MPGLRTGNVKDKLEFACILTAVNTSSDFPTKLKFAVPVKHALEHFSAEKLSL